MKTLSLKIPDTLEGDLVAFAKERGVSRSQVMREALMSLLSQERPRARSSALAMMGDLVGSVEGPQDLSSNPSYLDDLGQ